MVANPAAYGFTNVTDACFNGTTVCANPSQYLFFDDFHPTSEADAFVADGFLSTVVPEPANLLIVGMAFLGLVICRNRIRTGPIEGMLERAALLLDPHALLSIRPIHVRFRLFSGRAIGSCQPRRIAIKRSPKQRIAPVAAAAPDGTCSICPTTTAAAPIRAATA